MGDQLEHVTIMPVKDEENLHYIHNVEVRPKNVLEQSAFWNLYGFLSLNGLREKKNKIIKWKRKKKKKLSSFR